MYKFAGYDLCGCEGDGHTIFMFVKPEDESKGFTLSLRDHDGHDDHDELNFEGDGKIPDELLPIVSAELKDVLIKHRDNQEVCEVINRCLANIAT
jgi:hypothetical protein